jgi:hypothetical protein
MKIKKYVKGGRKVERQNGINVKMQNVSGQKGRKVEKRPSSIYHFSFPLWFIVVSTSNQLSGPP